MLAVRGCTLVHWDGDWAAWEFKEAVASKDHLHVVSTIGVLTAARLDTAELQ